MLDLSKFPRSKTLNVSFLFIFLVFTVSAQSPQLENGNSKLPSLDTAVQSNNTFNIGQIINNITNNINQFDQSLNTTDLVTFVNVTSGNLLPSSNNTGSVGSEQLQWNAGFFQNLNVSNLGGLSPINLLTNIEGASFNITADTFFGDVNFSQLAASSQSWNANYTNLIADACTPNFAIGIFVNGSFICGAASATDASWVANWTAYNDTWSSITNISYLLVSNWNSTNSSYLEIINWNATNDTYVKDTGDNMTGNLNMTGNNIFNVGSGFFNFLGSLTERITKIFATDVDISNNLSVGANLSVDSGTLFVDSSKDFVGINTTTPDATLNVVGDLNQTQGNLTGNFIHGEMFNRDDDGVTIDLTVVNKFENFTNLTAGILHAITFTDNGLIPLISGEYIIQYSGSFTSAASSKYLLGVAVNGIIQNNTVGGRTIGAGGSLANAGGLGIISVNAGEIVNLQVADVNAPAQDFTYTSVNINMVRVGELL